MIILYNIVNYTFTKTTGQPVYSFMPWNSVISWGVAFFLFFVGILLYTGLCKLTEWKFRRLNMTVNTVILESMTGDTHENKRSLT